jgi:hypothetical protein
MALTTLASTYTTVGEVTSFKISGLGVPQSTAYLGGQPPVYASVTTAGGIVVDSTVAGGIPIPIPSTGDYYISGARISNFTTGGNVQGSILVLCDRLWHYSGTNLVTAGTPTINSVTLPARDVNSSTLGEGVYPLFEVRTGLGAVISCTFNYTNSAGTAGRTSQTTALTATTQGHGLIAGLQLGDTGVRSIQTVTISATTTGAAAISLFRPIAAFSTRDPGLPAIYSPIGTSCPRLPSGASLFWLRYGNSSLGVISSTLSISYG